MLDALEADRDVTTDPAVLAALVGQGVQQSANGIEDALGARAAAFLTEHAETLLGAFGKPFDGYAAAVNAAVAKFGDINPEDTSSILNRGGDAAQVWASAQDATSGIGDIRQTWKILSQVSSAFTTDPRHTVLTIADIDPAVYVDQQITGWLTPWEVARRGWQLSLATPAVYRQRVAGVREEHEKRAAVRADAFRVGYRRSHGIGAA